MFEYVLEFVDPLIDILEVYRGLDNEFNVWLWNFSDVRFTSSTTLDSYKSSHVWLELPMYTIITSLVPIVGFQCLIEQ